MKLVAMRTNVQWAFLTRFSLPQYVYESLLIVHNFDGIIKKSFQINREFVLKRSSTTQKIKA